MVAVTQPDRSEDSLPPPRKRIRTESTKPKIAKEPRLFAPFRALGLVTNHVPFVLQTRSYKGAAEGPSLHLVTCLGKSWAMWEGGRMTLQFVGECLPCKHICSLAHGDLPVSQVLTRVSRLHQWLWRERQYGLPQVVMWSSI